MKKLLLIAAFAAIVPFCADAASPVFDDAGAFTVAKAVKLGRGKAYRISGGQSFGDSTFNEDKTCCEHCVSCDKTTGKCLGCEEGYVLNEGRCEKLACGDGTYEKNGSCVSICTGVSCNTSKGFKAVSYNTKCCCERTSVTCAAGQYVSGTSCISCPVGTYSTGGSMTSCTSCPSGTTTSGRGATSSSACYSTRVPCQPGSYKSGTSCVKCAAGTYSTTEDASSCTACADGTYSVEGATSCNMCSKITIGSNDAVGGYYSESTYNGATCYSKCTTCSTTGVCLGSNLIEGQSSACYGSSSESESPCPVGSTRKTLYFCDTESGSGRPWSICDYGDYGNSCTKPSQCKSGFCVGNNMANSSKQCTSSSFQGSVCH